MARAIVAVYDSFYLANKAVQELAASGYPRNMIDILSRSSHEKAGSSELALQSGGVKPEIQTGGQAAGIQIGAGIGGAVGVSGGLLAGLGMLHLPGLFATAAGRPLAAALAGLALAGVAAGIGSLAGMLLGWLLGLGIPEEEARQYAKNVRNGEVMVNVMADWDTVDPVIEILSKHSPLEVKEKAISWQKSGRVGLKRTSRPQQRHDRR